MRWPVAAFVLNAILVACGGGAEGASNDVGVEVLFPDLGGDAGLDLGSQDPGSLDPDGEPDQVVLPYDEDTKTGCTDGASTCQGADTLAVCVDGAWKTSVCSVTCAEQGLASLGCVEGACSCGVPPQCDPGETRCQGANTVAICTDGAWVPTSCTVQCAEGGLASAGCVDDACSCTDQPPECEDGEATCETSEVRAVCVDGQWQATPCAEACEAEGKDSHGCLGETCQCVDKPLCYMGTRQCVAATSLATCNGASWDLASCADVCAGKGMLGDQCVGDDCACTPAPDCTDGQALCDGATRLDCVGATWIETPCATVCAEQGLLGGQCADGACSCLGDQGPACPGCLGGACAAATATCRSSAPCAALTACLTGCADASACTSACAAAHPTGMAGLAVLLDCAAASCPGQCPDLPGCFEGQARCASTTATEVCQGGHWLISNCGEACYANGLKSNGCSGGTCACVFDPFVCEHGAVGCPTPQSRATCQYGQWGPQVSCASECASQGQVSSGCSAGACTCELPCTTGQQRCGDAATLLSCDVPPNWSPHNCESECTLKSLLSLGCGSIAGSDDCLCVTSCGFCVHEDCAAQTAACEAASCSAWIACDDQCWYDSYACGEYSYDCYYSCALGCTNTYPDGPAAWNSLYTCQFETCGYACN